MTPPLLRWQRRLGDGPQGLVTQGGEIGHGFAQRWTQVVERRRQIATDRLHDHLFEWPVGGLRDALEALDNRLRQGDVQRLHGHGGLLSSGCSPTQRSPHLMAYG